MSDCFHPAGQTGNSSTPHAPVHSRSIRSPRPRPSLPLTGALRAAPPFFSQFLWKCALRRRGAVFRRRGRRRFPLGKSFL